jgi:hypothetical protein
MELSMETFERDKPKRKSRADYAAERNNTVGYFLDGDRNDEDTNDTVTAVPPQVLADDADPPIGADVDAVSHLIIDHEANGGIEGGDAEPDFEYSPGGSDAIATNGSGYMAEFLKRLQQRLNAELTSEKITKEVINYLKLNNFWVRAECVPQIACILGYPASGIDRYYLNDVKVWLPDTQFGNESMPCCPTCGRNQAVVPHSFQTNHPARRIITNNTHYFLMSRTYRCKDCENEHNKKKRDAEKVSGQQTPTGEAVTRKRPPKTQYTFMGSHEESLKRFTKAVRESFPAVLSAKSGLDVVKNVPMSITKPLEQEVRQTKRSCVGRGFDKRKRAPRRCATCLQQGKEAQAAICPGRGKRIYCIHQH